MTKRTKKPMESKSVRMSEEEMKFLQRNGQRHSSQLHHDIRFLKSLLELDKAAGDRLTLREALEFCSKVLSSPEYAVAILGSLLKSSDPTD